MLFFNPGITTKNQNGVYEFTCDNPEYNQVTVPVLYEEKKCQKIYVGIDDVSKYLSTPYFPVRLQCFYDNGTRFFYTTGYISREKIFLPNDTLEVIVSHLFPLIDIEPLDKNEYGNNQKSKLAMYGYNVRKNELTKTQRHAIIDFVIGHYFMTPMDVVHLLEHHVEYIHNWYAQKQWEIDIEYVRNKYIMG